MHWRFDLHQMLGITVVLVAFFLAEFMSGQSFDGNGPRMEQAQASRR